ncbi:hypothetical protein A3G56_01640 [Candidatus Falkowbacteria bacterium RIFCSPLOWO2_12_FULL_45_10]|uniref:Sulfotransferase domain-containing protein n=3 Tax=Candidatus Falkowiibacteriota TaxID=1752728 RepID=A0A1F5RJN7_9BACT|nr:MAG: hypothetical protein A3D54_01530 [Candidatus Falkowbacteria bacterium RIFCSPHIGHO2_02_FULL_45_15]OGF19572.1 MAG: hypothetical protein A3I35_01865 [Candidatus Falkowbacteria bacterium RIFCSPLOWO2_02_FULL_45_15]OGF19798.1 MAG: hypothetical protein A3G56_01640 [Candidatus Falkowbacteria bacterium RIFCSPLOWO2_12_FULL_45_10]
MIITVAGYVKSGSTWLARLLGEAIDCPIKGYKAEKMSRANETAIEGLNRKSEHEIWKSHSPAPEHDPKKTVVIQRDPRDIAVSGHHLYTVKPSINEMLDCLAEGKGGFLKPTYWTPYKKYYQDFRAAGFHIVRYEDLIDRPVAELEKMIRHLGIEPDRDRIAKAVHNQSFKVKKRKFLFRLELKKYFYMRKGVYGEYKKEFSGEELAKAERLFFS